MTIAQTSEWWKNHLGDHESPPNSNHTPVWTIFHKLTKQPAYQGSPYCGAALVDSVIRGNIDIPIGELAAWIGVYNLQKWAMANGRWSRDHTTAKKGDALVLLGPGVHCGWAREDWNEKRGVQPTYEANTSPGAEGSQFNGGTIAEKERTAHEVYGVVRLHDKYGEKKQKPVKLDELPDHSPQYRKEHRMGDLHIWETGPRVAKLQVELGIESDGYFGRTTAKAVAAKLRKFKMKGDGETATTKFIVELAKRHEGFSKEQVPSTLHRGDLGALVRKLQRQLNAEHLHHFDPEVPTLKDDGDYGEKTAKAVHALKRRMKLKNTDGDVAGEQVWKELLNT